MIQITPNFCIGLPDDRFDFDEAWYKKIMENRKNWMIKNGVNINHLPTEEEWEHFQHRQKKIERVASGLRKMKCKPDAFVISPFEENTWDEDKILDIPVYHFDVPIEYGYNCSIVDPPCYFMPIWKNERSRKQFLSKQFFLGWEEISY